MYRLKIAGLLAVIVSCHGAPVVAQWIDQPTPGIPRTVAGKPDMAAPTPRTADGHPDLSGLWGLNPGAYTMNIAAELKPDEIRPQANELFKQRLVNLQRDDPSQFRCLPQGPRFNLFPPLMIKLVQTPALIVALSEDLTYRQIFLDGRQLPKDPDPSFMGYSVGHWEGDTLVVQTIGFKDTTWLDFGGHPHSEVLRTTERYRRRDVGHMEIEETLEDPVHYARPWTIVIQAHYVPDTELLEYVCAENERDRRHLVGTAFDDEKYAVKVAPAVLAAYVGTYEFFYPENPTTGIHYNVTLSDGQLFMATEGKDKAPLTPLSETLFSLFGDRLEFARDGRGAVTHFAFIAAEGNLKAVRRPDPR